MGTILALENVKSLQGFGDFKQHQEKVERCQITWRKYQRFFSKQWETFGEDGGVEKMSKLYGECQNNAKARLNNNEEHWTTLKTKGT